MFEKLNIRSLAISIAMGLFLAACGSDSSDEKVKSKSAMDPVPIKEQSNQAPASTEALPSSTEMARQALIGSQFDVSSASEVAEYKRLVKETLASDVPVLALTDLSGGAEKAQSIFLADERLVSLIRDRKSGEAIRTEVMSVTPAQPGDRIGLEEKCAEKDCYRINSYNFFFNATLTALVNVRTEQIVAMGTIPETQPDLSVRLEELASAIAKQEPMVQQEIARYISTLPSGEKPSVSAKPLMASTKSSLRNSLCERSKHLCVAPVYVLGETALWVIVDLTDFKVVGVRWTAVGSSGPPVVITERKLENEYVFENFCERVNSLERNGWAFDYHITSSDGLRVADLRYQGNRVLKSVKVVDWHISYSGYDRFGFSDATGCPMFSSAVVVAYKGPKVEPIMQEGKEVGFSIAQDFRQLPWPAPCNYRYQEKYEFYNDGRYRVAVANHGRGCGINGTYRPIVRIDYGRPSPSSAYELSQWNDNNWQVVAEEMWSQQPQNDDLESGKYSHKIANADGTGYLMAPGSGQFGDGGRGDNAFVYVTVGHEDVDEGERDLVTLGDCCNTDHRQGPERFLEPAEPLQNESLVLWYVPQLENDGSPDSRYCWADIQLVDGVQKTETWPCVGGPMFVPISAASSNVAGG